jgi:hypothetical protein
MKGMESFLIVCLSICVGLTLGGWLSVITVPKFPISVALVLTLIDAFFVLLILANKKYNK